MQDKNLHIDKAFTDKAWQEMQTLLDQEMPVTKKKRRFLLWWYAGGIAIAASLIGLWITSTNPTKAPIQNSPSLPIVHSSTSLAQSSENNNEPVVTINESKLNSQSDATTQSDNNKKTNLNELPKADKTTPKPLINNGLPVEELTSQQPFSNTSSPLNANEEILQRISTPNLLENIELIPLNHSPISDIELPIEPIKNGRIQLITEGTAYFTSKDNGSGLGASLLAGIPIGKSNFSIESGIQYSYIRQPLSYLIEVTQDDTSFETVGTVADISYGNGNFLKEANAGAHDPLSSFPYPTERLGLHYAHIPLTLSYRLNRIRFFGGIQAGLLLTTSGSNLKGGTFNNARQETIDPAGVPNNMTSNNILAGQQKLNNFELAGSAGFGFDFSRHLGVNVAYRYGLSDVIQSNTQQDRNQLMKLALRYTW